MKATPSYTRPTIRKGRNKVSGDTDVLIYYHHKNTEYFGTNVEINPKYWNKKHSEVKSNIPENSSVELNEIIYNVKNKLDNLVHEYKKENRGLPIGTELRRLYMELLTPPRNREDESRIFISNEFSKWINHKKEHQNISDSSVKVYSQTLKYIKEFMGFREMPSSSEFYLNYEETKYTIKTYKDINLTFIEKFRNWLSKKVSRKTKEKLSNSTINKRIHNIQSFLKERSLNGEDIDARVFNVKLESKFAGRQFLTETEIQKIINLNIADIPASELSEQRKNTLSMVKDIFEFNIWFGLRVSDLFKIQKNNVFISDVEKDNYLLLWIDKTKKPAQLPILTDTVKQIIIKYLEIDNSDSLFPKLSVTSYNKYLGLLAKHSGITQLVSQPIFSNQSMIAIKKPKWQLISSHSIRKTSINKNILDHSREVAKFMSTHQSESAFKQYEDMSDYDRMFDKMKGK